MTEVRRYTFKLYPNKTQSEALEHQCVLLARLWNAALQEREDQWRREVDRKGHWRRLKRPADEKPKGLSYYDQARSIKYIRAENPEYAAMSCASLELCLKSLDLAFKAFWRRLKEGCDAGSAGYPKYKSARRHRTIWHRDGSGWKMKPSGKHWRFYFKGIDGTIKARGRFPLDPEQIRTMEVIERDGAWHASVVVYQRARMSAGKQDLRIEFDLLDEFAVVKNAASGEYLPGLTPVFLAGEGRIITQNQRANVSSAQDAANLGGDGRCRLRVAAEVSAQDAANLGGDGRTGRKDAVFAEAQDAANLGGDGSGAIQLQRDRRYKKFSHRWKREKNRIARRAAKQARQRKEALHQWTTKVVQHASEITVIAPSIKDHTKSGRGDKYEWGGAVKTVAELNRNTLSQAPAMAIQMLEYKAAEADIAFRVIKSEDAKISIGGDLKETVKTARKVRRELKEAI